MSSGRTTRAEIEQAIRDNHGGNLARAAGRADSAGPNRLN